MKINSSYIESSANWNVRTKEDTITLLDVKILNNSNFQQKQLYAGRREDG